MKTLLLIILTCSISISAMAQTNSTIDKAKSLYHQHENKKALKLYKQVLEENPENSSALWHASLLYSRLGEQFKKEDQKIKYFKKAENKANKALKVDSTSSRANFAMAVALGEMARLGSLDDKLKAASEIKKYAVSAIHADSSNAGAWFVLGAWNYKISTMGSVKGAVANLFADIPDASTKKAVKYMNKAIDLHPSYILYHYYLAQVYQDIGKKDKAVKACQLALKKPAATHSDTDYKEKCKDIIHKIKS